MLITLLPVFAGNERLIGAWKSNRDTTVAYLKIHTNLSSQQLDLVSQALGKTTITFDKANVTIASDDWKFTSSYKIISESKNSMTIESQDPGTQKLTQTVFELDRIGFWTSDDRIPGYKERFEKLVQKQDGS